MTYTTQPAASIIRRWPTAKARAWTEEFLARVVEDPNVLAVVAVGSAVCEGVQSDDVDLVVVCKDCEAFDYRAPIEVDLHGCAADQVDVKLGEGHSFLGWAVRFGRVLFDRDGIWAGIHSSWRERLPLPDPALARQRAERARKLAAELRTVGDTAAADEQELSYLTLLARAVLAENGVYPASRPELPGQLRPLGKRRLAEKLHRALQ